MSGMNAYAGLMRLAAPALRRLLQRRARRGRELDGRLDERYGSPAAPRPEGALVWIHAVSVGEVRAAAPLVDALLARYRVSVLVTTGTVSGAETVAGQLPRSVLHQFLPLDHPDWNRRFLDHWRPDAVLWMESDYWPGMLGEIARRGIPAALVNGRISHRSARRWRWLPGMIRAVLARFEVVLAADTAQAERLEALGARRPQCVHNLKAVATPSGGGNGASELTRCLRARHPAWVAASTHPGEEDLALAVHGQLRDRQAGLLTVIAPRHVGRADDVLRACRRMGWATATRSQDGLPGREHEIFILDHLGELGAVYAGVSAALVGGSLVAEGGHNPYEPVRARVPLLHGPHVENFAGAHARLARAGGARRVHDADALASVVDELLNDPAARTSLTEAAENALPDGPEILADTLAALTPVLEHLPSRKTVSQPATAAVETYMSR